MARVAGKKQKIEKRQVQYSDGSGCLAEKTIRKNTKNSRHIAKGKEKSGITEGD